MKENIINCIKVFFLIYPAVAGYLFMYLLAWQIAGLPINSWSLLLLTLLAGLSEYLYIKWVG